MQSNPDTWAQQYDRLPNLLWLLEDRASLPELLKTYIEAHPGESGDSARRALDEIRKRTFVARSEDDAEEYGDGRMDLDSSYLAVWHDPGRGPEREVQFVGLRFANLQIPKGAQIRRAYVEFDVSRSRPENGMVVHGELTANAQSFTNARHNISDRRKTSASVKCPELWRPAHSGSYQSVTVSPNLASIVQEVVNQSDWREGNALVLIISGSASARSYDHLLRRSPMLYVDY
jgi:hypothetical protein